jgi:hypothetical protein
MARHTWLTGNRLTAARLNSRDPGAWQTPTLAGTWVNLAGGYQPIKYRLVDDMIEMVGVITNASVVANPSTLFTLAAGWRPAAAQHVATVAVWSSASRAVCLDIATSGVIVLDFHGAIGAAVGHLDMDCRFALSA